MADDLTDTIASNAAQPRKASGDSGSVENHSLDDLIKADRYLKSESAATGTGLGIKRTKIVPPGAS